jgi:excisionase family DNA binding protein
MFPKCDLREARRLYEGMGLNPLASEATAYEQPLIAVQEPGPQKERLTLTVDEAAELLGVSRSTAYSLVRQGELPSLRLGRRIVVPVRRLLALLDGGPVA